MSAIDLCVWANLSAALFLTGLIWVIQVVHYPLFARVGAREFAGYAEAHGWRITCVVGPAMLIEGVAAVALVVLPGGAYPRMAAWCGLALCVAIWASTVWLQVPCHDRLRRGFDPAVHRRLVRTNWLRTVAWTIRSALAIYLMQHGAGPLV